MDSLGSLPGGGDYPDLSLPPTLNLGLRLNLTFDLVYFLFSSFSLFSDLHHWARVLVNDAALIGSHLK